MVVFFYWRFFSHCNKIMKLIWNLLFIDDAYDDVLTYFVIYFWTIFKLDTQTSKVNIMATVQNSRYFKSGLHKQFNVSHAIQTGQIDIIYTDCEVQVLLSKFDLLFCYVTLNYFRCSTRALRGCVQLPLAVLKWCAAQWTAIIPN